MIVSGLRCAYSTGPEILCGVDMEIPAGAVVGVMGSNGSGKSTLALCLKGLLHPSGGTIDWPAAPPRSDVGLVFQNPDNQLVTMSVEREIAFGLENQNVLQPEMRQRVEAILERFQLASLRNRAPHQLSGGERQKLACASVLVTNPRLLILDEATAMLDPAERRQVLHLVREECLGHRDRGMRLVLISQFPDEVLQVDHLYVLHKGSVELHGLPDAVFRHREQLDAIGVGVPVPYACL